MFELIQQDIKKHITLIGSGGCGNNIAVGLVDSLRKEPDIGDIYLYPMNLDKQELLTAWQNVYKKKDRKKFLDICTKIDNDVISNINYQPIFIDPGLTGTDKNPPKGKILFQKFLKSTPDALDMILSTDQIYTVNNIGGGTGCGVNGEVIKALRRRATINDDDIKSDKQYQTYSEFVSFTVFPYRLIDTNYKLCARYGFVENCKNADLSILIENDYILEKFRGRKQITPFIFKWVNDIINRVIMIMIAANVRGIHGKINYGEITNRIREMDYYHSDDIKWVVPFIFPTPGKKLKEQSQMVLKKNYTKRDRKEWEGMSPFQKVVQYTLDHGNLCELNEELGFDHVKRAIVFVEAPPRYIFQKDELEKGLQVIADKFEIENKDIRLFQIEPNDDNVIRLVVLAYPLVPNCLFTMLKGDEDEKIDRSRDWTDVLNKMNLTEEEKKRGMGFSEEVLASDEEIIRMIKAVANHFPS